MKRIVSFVLVFSLFTYGGLFTKSTVYAEEPVSITSNDNNDLIVISDSIDLTSMGEYDIEPYSVTVSAAITYLTYYCILYCHYITDYIHRLEQTHGMGTVYLTKSLWLSYSNSVVTEKKVTPKSSQNSWNAPKGCIWSGPSVGGQWLCPMILAID